MKQYSFERLEVWQNARAYNKEIYLISESFPNEERYGLTSQIRRAAISVSSNIAEGSSRKSGKEQARYIEIAYGSLLETLSQLLLAFDLEYISELELNKIRPKTEEIGNKLNKLRQVLLTK